MHKHVLLQYSDILYLRVKLNIKWGEITGLYIIACIVKVDIILQNGVCLEDEGLKRGICHMSRKDVLKVFQLWFWWLQRQMSKECVINRVKSAFMLALNRFMFLPMPIRFYNSTLAHIHSMFLSIQPSLSIFPLLVFFWNSVPLYKITGV